MKNSKWVQSFKLAITLAFIMAAQAAHAGDHLKDLSVTRHDYNGFSLWLDCKERAAIMFRYNAQRDSGNFPREKEFTLDSNTSIECQQSQNGSYKGAPYMFDRGHQVPANHLDNDGLAIHQSNYMTNILPQTATLNRGAWLASEEMIECIRDNEELLVLGGPIMGNDASNDFFVKSHGIRTPDYFWKVVVGNQRSIAWIMPNDTTAVKGNIDQYIVSINDIEKIAGVVVPVEAGIKANVERSTWESPRGCKKG